MSLMNLVRSIGAMVMVWTLVAIGIGRPASACRPVGRRPPAAESPSVDAMPATWPRVERYDLIDRTSGRKSPFRVPEEGRWSLLSVSPWRGPGGELEAAGRWVSRGKRRLLRLGTVPAIRPRRAEPGRDRSPPLGTPLLGAGTAADDPVPRRRWPAPSLPAGRRGRGAGGRHTVEARDGRRGESGPGGLGGPVSGRRRGLPAGPRLARYAEDEEVGLRGAESAGCAAVVSCVYAPPRLWWLEMSEGARVDRRRGPAGRDVRVVGRGGSRHRGAVTQRRRRSLGRDPAGLPVAIVPSGTWRLRSALVDFDGRTGARRPCPATAPYPIGTRGSSPRRWCCRPTGRRSSACRDRAASPCRSPAGPVPDRRSGRLARPAQLPRSSVPISMRAGRAGVRPILSRADPVCHAGMVDARLVANSR